MNNWKGIKTAPKDGRYIVVRRKTERISNTASIPGSCSVVRWNGTEWEYNTPKLLISILGPKGVFLNPSEWKNINIVG